MMLMDRMGQQIDSYRLIRLLGVGGFGEVYLGEHVYHKYLVAIKVLPQLEKNELLNFLNEARTFRLKHPNIVHIQDFGVDGSTPFLVMDYAPNGSLRQRYARGTRLPLPVVLGYVKHIASALQYAHNERLIHRDIKPENMLLGHSQEVLLTDFGIALIVQGSRFRNTQELAGTAAYIAPEQILGRPCFASDQYSLGVLVYEWLCGECPFQGSSMELYGCHLHASPPSLNTKCPTISRDIEQVVLRALAKDPQQRFANVQAFAVALERAVQMEKIARTVQVVQQPLHLASIPALETAPQPIAPSSATEAIQPDKPEPSLRNVSRRAVVRTLLGLAVLGTGGGMAAFLMTKQAGPTSARVQTPTPIALGTTLTTYARHSDWVSSVAWSPDGQHIASGSADATVQVWDARNASTLLTYTGHTKGVRTVRWSPHDGRYIASGGDDATVRVWDAMTGETRLIYPGHQNIVKALAWSPLNGSRIASASLDHTVQVWDALTGNNVLLYSGHSNHQVYALAWSPNGQYIVSADGHGTVQVWDAITGAIITTYQGHGNSPVGAVAWSPDSQYIASGAYNDDDTVRVWNARTGETQHIYPRSQLIYAIAWSPDGKFLAYGGQDDTVKLWDVRSNKLRYTFSSTQSVIAVMWSPEGKRIASGGFDSKVWVWQAQ